MSKMKREVAPRQNLRRFPLPRFPVRSFISTKRCHCVRLQQRQRTSTQGWHKWRHRSARSREKLIGGAPRFKRCCENRPSSKRVLKRRRKVARGCWSCVVPFESKLSGVTASTGRWPTTPGTRSLSGGLPEACSGYGNGAHGSRRRLRNAGAASLDLSLYTRRAKARGVRYSTPVYLSPSLSARRAVWLRSRAAL